MMYPDELKIKMDRAAADFRQKPPRTLEEFAEMRSAAIIHMNRLLCERWLSESPLMRDES